MNLPEKFEKHIKNEFSFLQGKRLLLACSGGLDSVVLAHLAAKSNFDFALAHCNFSLRGKESDTDEMFVVGLAKQFEIPVFVETFQTEKYAETKGISIQLAARELRYAWFEKLLSDFNYDYVLTAHHSDDDLETFLINLSRGTGLKGLSGIPKKNGKIIRPLLDFSRKTLFEWATSEKIRWREDSSNEHPDYLRNKIRLEVVPKYKEVNSKLLQNFKTTQKHLQDSASLIEDYMALVFRLVIIEDKNGYRINIEKIKNLPNTKALLYELLNDFGFTQWDDVFNLLESQTGKQVYSKTHRLLRNRGELMLTQIPGNFENVEIFVSEKGIDSPVSLHMKEVEHISTSEKNVIHVDLDSITFPLTLRKIKEGDFFYPFGMSGKKKISKFFKDEKFSLPEKENAWLLCSGEEIIWVVNHRLDNRFRVTSKTKRILMIRYEPDNM